MNQDIEHLRLLSLFHYIVGGITALFACLPLIHIAIGIIALNAPVSPGQDHFPQAFGWIFIVVGAFFVIMGWALAVAIIVAGRFLANRKHRIFCLVVAAFECLFMPFGTILGVFSIIVLVRPSVQELFREKAEEVQG